MKRYRTVVLLLIILVYWAVSLENLSVFPPVTEDEPWIAAAPYKLATQGVYGSDLFAGYYGLERHNYQHMPFFPLLQAGVFRLGGVGVFQMRLLPVTFGMLLLAGTFVVGRRLGGTQVALLALLLLVGLRLGTGHNETGIPLLDIARINRYDIAVPALGLLAWLSFDRAVEKQGGGGYLVSGILIGLSSLSHLYGLFWLPTLGAILLARYGWRAFRMRGPYLMLLGVGLTWLPWLAYVASGWQDYRGQTRLVAERFDLFNWRFYLHNLLHEVDRYRTLDLTAPSGRLYWERPGAWIVILGAPVALGMLIWRGRRKTGRRTASLALAFLVQGLLFAALLQVKQYNYMIAVWPLLILCLAWLGVWLWRGTSRWWARGLLLLLLGLVLSEGGGRILHRRAASARVTPYDQFESRVAALIPGSRVLGLQHYWLGLRRYTYRTWLLPWLMTGERYFHAPITLDQALEWVAPDVILLDRHMGGLFAEAARPTSPYHSQYEGFRVFMRRHDAVLAGVVEDTTYGRMEVYWLDNRGSNE